MTLRFTLWIAVIAAVVTLGIWVTADNSPVPVPVPAAPAAPVESKSVWEPIEQREVENAAGPVPVVLPSTPRPAQAKEKTISELVQQIRSTSGVEDRLGLVQELAGRNSAEAVMAIQQLFVTERHPKVKAGLLSGLSDIDASLVPSIRLQILTTALQGEAREVRSTALDLLSETELPAATALLERAMKNDPDRELREVAAAFYRDRIEAR
ncbi:MAG TPA: HEAT repeat domain-containing protein [Chthoniobacteraceae bacterium]|nr:HEAT repeat domain-containing protein [Chthoniobacteraceae bacterium]